MRKLTKVRIHSDEILKKILKYFHALLRKKLNLVRKRFEKNVMKI